MLLVVLAGLRLVSVLWGFACGWRVDWFALCVGVCWLRCCRFPLLVRRYCFRLLGWRVFGVHWFDCLVKVCFGCLCVRDLWRLVVLLFAGCGVVVLVASCLALLFLCCCLLMLFGLIVLVIIGSLVVVGLLCFGCGVGNDCAVSGF